LAATVTAQPAAGTRSCRGTAYHLDLQLPRRAETIGKVRRALDGLLATLRVSAECRQGIALAVTEVCANAVEHAAGADDYHVAARVVDGRCQISVTDHGCGFQPIAPQLVPPRINAESGRGLHLITALADQFELHTQAGRGTQVRLGIALAYS
jgi:serine/threonine-protein kinase RsbW